MTYDIHDCTPQSIPLLVETGFLANFSPPKFSYFAVPSAHWATGTEASGKAVLQSAVLITPQGVKKERISPSDRVSRLLEASKEDGNLNFVSLAGACN